MVWIEDVIKTEGHYVCDQCKKKRGLLHPIDLSWSAGHFSGGSNNFCCIRKMASFLKKNPKVLENTSNLKINDCYLARWVLRIIMQNHNKMTKEALKWDKFLDCKNK